jgi:hypothetical protein
MDTRIAPAMDERTAELMDRIALAEQQVSILHGEQQRMARHELALLETELARLAQPLSA